MHSRTLRLVSIDRASLGSDLRHFARATVPQARAR
jgi:hypothetical protein